MVFISWTFHSMVNLQTDLYSHWSKVMCSLQTMSVCHHNQRVLLKLYTVVIT